MKPDERHIEEVLRRSLPSAPAEQMESALARIHARLQSDRGETVSAGFMHVDSRAVGGPVAPKRWRGWWSPVTAAAAALLVGAIWIGLSVRDGVVYAVLETPDRSLFRIADGHRVPVHAGERIGAQEPVQSNGGAVLALADGSHVEMRSQAELSLERAGDGVSIRLSTGSIIVNAAKQHGHLYVQTKDVMVSVVGTVFLVNTEEAGSRVAVIQGEVYVQQGTTAKKLLPGEQVATNPLMESHPVIEQFSWSHEAETHVATLQQSAVSESTQSTPITRRLEFEAASLRALEPGAFPGGFLGCKGVDGMWLYDRDVAGFGGPADPPSVPQGRCIGSGNVTRFLAAAYGIPVSRVSSNEKELWLYRLDAKAGNTESATTGQLREMLQNLMLDRFKLKAHRYTEEKSGYFLVVAKGGPKFQETSGDEEMPRPRVGPFGQGSLPYLIKGKFRLKNFAQFLSSASVANNGRPIVDRTELSGLYDISLTLHQTPSVGVRGGGGAVTSEMWDPPLADALEDQLGLRLESAAKVPLEYLSVDHIERPSEN